jgi:hypothetical protein
LIARVATACLVVALAAPGAPAGEIPALDADGWFTRIADALRIDESMSARAHVEIDKPGRKDDFAFDMQLLRDNRGDAESRRIVLEMREVGDENTIVNEIVDKPGDPITNWYWDLQKRRWISVKGLLATDPWADTPFRYEDLWFTDPRDRRTGTVSVVEEGGRSLVKLASGSYHYYKTVETKVDPESGLPVHVRFIDNTGMPIREQFYEQVTVVDGRPFPTVVRLRDLAGGGQSTVTFSDVRFGRRIPPSFFDLSVINDRLRRGADPLPEPPDLPRASDAASEAEPAAAP